MTATAGLLKQRTSYLCGSKKSLINVDNFLNIKKSLTTLLGGNDYYESWNLKSDGPTTKIKGKSIYFEGNDVHPNELGHKKIAELIKEKIK